MRASHLALASMTCMGLATAALAQTCDPNLDRTLGTPGPSDSFVSVFATATLNGQTNLYAGGAFSGISGVPGTYNIARWTGSTWAPMDGGVLAGMANTSVNAMLEFNDGSGNALWVAGQFDNAPGTTNSKNLVKWDGTQWLSTNTEMVAPSTVNALTVYEGDLVIGGNFGSMGEQPINTVARWTGTGWEGVGSSYFTTASIVNDLIVWDDGSGPALFATGLFQITTNNSLQRIAKWNGTEWTLPGGGLLAGGATQGWSMAIFDDGTGPALYVGGLGPMHNFNAPAATRVVKWDGEEWSYISGIGTGGVRDLKVWDDGSGPALYAAVTFAGTNPVRFVAKLTETGFVQVNGFEANDSLFSLFNWQQGEREQLLVGGSFTEVNGEPVERIVAFRQCDDAPSCPGDFNNDGAVTTADITDYLSAWFAARASGTTGAADFNRDGSVTTADITAFLSAWFDARAGGC